MDVKKRFEGLLKEHGHDIIYGRIDKRFTCSCYSERSGEATRYCNRCMGAGYSLSLEKKRVRRQQASIPASLPNFLEYESAGSFHNETMCFYMEASSVPKNGDLIFEVSWERGEKKANGVQTKFIVTVVDPKMMNYGDVQFYQVYTRKIVKGDEDDVTISRRSF